MHYNHRLPRRWQVDTVEASLLAMSFLAHYPRRTGAYLQSDMGIALQ